MANHISDYEQQLFLNTWAKPAVEQMGLYGVPASITIAQAILESNWGKSRLALLSNNFFCIKANNGWAGPIVKHMDDEQDSSSFRQYLSIEESFHDHSKFLRENIRYRPLFLLSPTDYRGWAKGLKDYGYATASDYDTKLVAIIEKYGLYNYDAAVPVEQIQALGLPFGDLDEVQAAQLEPVSAMAVPSYVQPASAIAAAPSANANAAVLSMPVFDLSRAQLPDVPTNPTVVSSDFKASQIKMILPKSATRFQLRK